MLAWARPWREEPAARAEVEDEHPLRQPPRRQHAAHDVELAAHDCGAARRPRCRELAEGSPAPAEEHEGAPFRPVAAGDVKASGSGCRHRVIHLGRQVEQAPPPLAARRESIDATRTCPIGEKAADHSDLAPEPRGRHLGACERQRLRGLPRRARGGGRRGRQRQEHERECGREDSNLQGLSPNGS